jgi:hypothetical protein
MPQVEETANLKDQQDKKRANIVAKKQEIYTSLEQSDQSIEKSQQELVQLQGRIDRVYGIFDEAYRRLDQMPLIVALIIGIVYYAIYLPLNWPPSNWSAADGILTAIAAYGVLRIAFTILKVQVSSNVGASRLDSSLSNVWNLGKHLITGVRSYIPFLDEYYSGEERLQRQETFIRKLRNSLIQYGFVLNGRVEDYLSREFTSPSDSEEVWLNDASMNLSNLYGELEVIFRLAYADHESDEGARKVEWASICKSPQVLEHFATLLLRKDLLDIPRSYQEPVDPAIEYIVKIISPLTDFTLSGAKTLVSQSFSELELEKRDFLRMISANNISLTQGDREELTNLLPLEQPHAKVLNWLEAHTGVESYVLELFFLDFRALASEKDDYFLALKPDRNRIAVLSEELLERNIISIIERDEKHRKQDVSNLTDYLERISHYDKIIITRDFSRYRSLFEYSKSILGFLKIQKICSTEGALTFDTLQTQIENPEGEFLSHLQIMTQVLLEKYSSYSSRVEWLEAIALAVMTVFLVDSEDLFLREAICKRVAGKGRAVKILYEYSWTNWDEQDEIDSERTPLDIMITRVLDGMDRDPVHLIEFTKYLATGYLYKRIKEIPTGNLRYVETQMNSLSEKMDFKPKLEKHLKALKKVLQTRLLNTTTVMDSLRMQLVGAYAISIPTRADVLSAVIRDRLPEVVEELKSTDPRYVGLFLKSEGENTSFGNYVRVGVVPFRMEFRDFANLFENAYRIALNRYEQSGLMNKEKHSPEDYVANVIRIFPTSAYFRQLAPIQGRKPEDILADILKPLMIEKFGDVKTLEIIASLSIPDEREVAMKSVMTDLYDNNANIYGIASDDLDAAFAVSSSPSLADHIRSGLLDNDLKERFDTQHLSELAKMIHQSASSDLASSMGKTLRDHVADICKAIRAKPSEDDIERISSIIFEALNEIGMILNSLNA